ncbi:rRNA-processing protein bfr2 [Tilletia horrida]|nr:rRNA-processing protein bfr2 [Tilletia horrida]
MASSLAAQLALLTDVAPVDDGNEELLGFPSRKNDAKLKHGAENEADEDDDQEEEEDDEQDEFEDEEFDEADGASRAKDGEHLEGGDDDDDEDDDEDENEEEDDDQYEDEDEDEDEEDEDEDDFGGSADEDGNDEQAQNVAAAGTLASQAAESAALIESLKAEAAATAQRGRAIKRQQRDWDSILELRIRAQKVVRGAMRIDPASVEQLLKQSAAQEKHTSLLRQLDALSASLFVLRSRMLEQSHPDEVDVPTGLGLEHFTTEQGRARKRLKLESEEEEDEAGEAHQGAVQDLLALESRVLQPLAASILTAAHNKVNAATASSAASKAAAAKFNNMSAQTPTEQIDATFANHESRRRLVERTQVWRGDESLLRASQTSAADEKDEDDATLRTKAGARPQEADIFDDSDMYAHLLRELIESKTGRSASAVNASALSTAARGDGEEGAGGFNADLTLLAPGLLNGGRKIKRTVDTRASKGRKIRYEVNEKIANFMPPVPRLLWDEEQIDRLFSKLNTRLGDRDVIKRTGAGVHGGAAEEEEGEDVAVEGAEGTNVIDGLQLFG